MITQDQLKKLFSYQDGNLYNRSKRSRTSLADQKAGAINKHGRVYVKISGKSYLLHRLIFLYHHGWIPAMIDHKDTNPLNNKIENLRACSREQNNSNRIASKANKLGVKGVYQHRDGVRYQVNVRANNKLHYGGLFNSLEEAKAKADTMRKSLHGEFARNS